MEAGCFLRGPCRDVISKGQRQLIIQLSSVRQAVKIEAELVKVKNLHC
jgi:hypothetical protein